MGSQLRMMSNSTLQRDAGRFPAQSLQIPAVRSVMDVIASQPLADRSPAEAGQPYRDAHSVAPPDRL